MAYNWLPGIVLIDKMSFMNDESCEFLGQGLIGLSLKIPGTNLQ